MPGAEGLGVWVRAGPGAGGPALARALSAGAAWRKWPGVAVDSDQPEELGHSSRKLSAQSWGNPGGGGPGHPLPLAGQAGGQRQSMAGGCPAREAGPGMEEGLVLASHVVWGLGDLGPGDQQDGETEPQRGLSSSPYPVSGRTGTLSWESPEAWV